ncbi:MAG: AIR carboxylase family protein [Planctomycetaceae bacterium]
MYPSSRRRHHGQQVRLGHAPRAVEILDQFGVPHERPRVSAHRTGRDEQYARTAEQRGLKVIIAGAGGAASPRHGRRAPLLPVLGVPVQSKAAQSSIRSCRSSRCPSGVPVGTLAIGESGNAGLLAVRILATTDPQLRERLADFHRQQTDAVLKDQLP